MKKIFQILFLCFLLTSLGVSAQNAKISLESLNGKQILSTISVMRTMKELEGKPKMVRHRKITFKSEGTKTAAILSLSRHQQHFYISSQENFEIDTDNPLPSNDDEKGMLENYLKMINKPVKMIFSKEGSVETVKDNKFFTQGMWVSQIPKLNKIEAFSGIILAMPEKQSWIDSLKSETDKGFYINHYKVLANQDNKITVSLHGYFAPQKEIIPQNEVNEPELTDLNVALTAQTIIKRLEYDGDLVVDKTGLISNLSLRIKKKELIVIAALKHQEENESDEVLKIENQSK